MEGEKLGYVCVCVCLSHCGWVSCVLRNVCVLSLCCNPTCVCVCVCVRVRVYVRVRVCVCACVHVNENKIYTV